MKFTASRELGALGPKEGEPQIFSWPLSANLVPMFPWLLIVILLLRRANRDRRAWAIFLALAAAVAALHVLGKIRFPGRGSCMGLLLGVETASLAMAALLLMSHRLALYKPRNAFLLSVIFLEAMILVEVFNSFCDEVFWMLGQTIFLGGAIGLLALLGLILGRRECRKRFSPFRLVVRSFVWILLRVTPLLLFLGFIVSTDSYPDALFLGTLRMSGIFIGVLLAGTGTILLPFLVLVFHNSFYRERFLTLMRLPAPVQVEDVRSSEVPRK